MRTFIPEVVKSRYPISLYFIKEFLANFHDNKQDMINESHTIYRGIILNEYIPPGSQSFHDNGFMSFSKSKKVAKEYSFSKKDLGAILYIKPSDIFSCIHTPEEVLLYPGTLRFLNTTTGLRHSADNQVKYEPNTTLISEYMAMQPVDIPPREEQSSHKLSGKYAVFYRAIHDRHVEVFMKWKLPTDNNELLQYLNKHIPNQCSHYRDTVMPYIPGYRDLMAAMKPIKTNDDLGDIPSKIMSYHMHAAAYDPKTKRLITPNIFVHSLLFREVFKEIETRLDEIKEAIRQSFAS